MRLLLPHGRGWLLQVCSGNGFIDAPEFFGNEVIHDLAKFKAECDAIVANCWSDDLPDVADKGVHARLVQEGLAQKGLLFGGNVARLNRGVHRLAPVHPFFGLGVRRFWAWLGRRAAWGWVTR